MGKRKGRPAKDSDAPARRPTSWTRAQTLEWIMTRRLSAAADAVLHAYPAPGVGAPRGTSMRWVIEDTLRRMNAGGKERALPRFAEATTALANAESAGLILASPKNGLFRRQDVQACWPSPYGAASKNSDKKGGGVSPRKWNQEILQKLVSIFMTRPRDQTRDCLRNAVGNVWFNDPEKWTAYVRRAMAGAIVETLLRRQCRCPDDVSVSHCHSHYGRRFCFTSEEASGILSNIWSWRADGRLTKA
jgi:hypothetical protein